MRTSFMALVAGAMALTATSAAHARPGLLEARIGGVVAPVGAKPGVNAPENPACTTGFTVADQLANPACISTAVDTATKFLWVANTLRALPPAAVLNLDPTVCSPPDAGGLSTCVNPVLG